MDYLKLMQSQKAYAANYRKMPTALQNLAHHLCWQYNQTDPDDHAEQHQIIKRLFQQKVAMAINAPFHCDYGFNIHPRGFAFLNYGVTILDTSPVTLGKGVMIAPGVCIACSGHAINYRQRKEANGLLLSRPITIGDYVWIGAHCFIKGGVTIGSHSVIGAGSVVTHNIPANVVAMGTPCRVHRKITSKDLLKREQID